MKSLGLKKLNFAEGNSCLVSDLVIGTYVVEITKNISGIVSLYSNIFIFHGNATTIGNLNSETVCIGSLVNFSIDITATNGIGRNYMGSNVILRIIRPYLAAELSAPAWLHRYLK